MNTILMVDDDILFQQALEKQVNFSALGYERVLSATDVAQAAKIMEQQPVDVLLCDIEMPGKSGMDLIRWVAKNRYPVIVLLLTCHSNFNYAKEAIGLDVFDYLLKPIRIEVLEERLREALKKKNEVRWLDAFRQEQAKQQPKVPEKDPVSRIRSYIEENIHTELTREQLGRALFMNPDYIARVFREKAGQSLNDYIRSRRIYHAVQLLQETDLPLSDICEKIGYSYNTYFFNTFKKATGLSPNDYRNQTRKVK